MVFALGGSDLLSGGPPYQDGGATLRVWRLTVLLLGRPVSPGVRLRLNDKGPSFPTISADEPVLDLFHRPAKLSKDLSDVLLRPFVV